MRAGLLHTLDAKKKGKKKVGGGVERKITPAHTHTHTQRKRRRARRRGDEKRKNKNKKRKINKKVEKERSLPVIIDSQTFWHLTMQFHYNKPWDSLNLLAQSLCLNGPIPTHYAD